MIGLRAATEADKLHLAKCFFADFWHRTEAIENWMNAEVTTVFNPDGSPLFHLCFTEEEKSLRLHAQFNILEKYRTTKAIPAVFQMIVSVAQAQRIERLVFWSASPKLISLLVEIGFQRKADSDGDYEFVLSELPNGNWLENNPHYCRFGLRSDPEDEDPCRKGNFEKN